MVDDSAHVHDADSPGAALITGASGGLGRALAERLHADGWRLVVVGRDAARLRQAYGQDHLQVEADCSTPQGACDAVRRCVEQGWTPRALAHCAGNIRLGAAHRVSPSDWEECLRANLHSAFHMLGAFVAELRRRGSGGSAVFVSSAAARVGTPNHEAVAAAKGGVEALVRAAAASHAGAGIRVNAVAPGLMLTAASAGLIASPAARDAAQRQYPLPGLGEPREVAELMAWLLSDKAARVTGQVWELDGGFAAIRPIVKG